LYQLPPFVAQSLFGGATSAIDLNAGAIAIAGARLAGDRCVLGEAATPAPPDGASPPGVCAPATAQHAEAINAMAAE
jgi:hypothetical protein